MLDCFSNACVDEKAVKEISVIGRNTQGVRLITLESKDEKVAGVARLAEVGKDEEGTGDEAPAE